MKLSGRTVVGFDGDPIVGMIDDPALSRRAPSESRLQIRREIAEDAGGRSETVQLSGEATRGKAIQLPPELNYLGSGDIVRINPKSPEIRVLYRKASPHNVLFFTERCNSRCLMCSQPPRDVNDDFLIDDILRIIPWMSEETRELAITGGEPTLQRERLIDVVESAKLYLPKTALHLLSNGRLFAYLRLAERLAAPQHPNLGVGIPLYGDVAGVHDFIVQARGAFGQTIQGILNLARVGVSVEIRIVVHGQSLPRLKQLARFVARNLPFADQVVFMGLEPTGYARSNFGALWADPAAYESVLVGAVEELDSVGIECWIYNHPLCLLPRALWSRARQSISDWKNIFLPECQSCAKRAECCGFFASASSRHSAHIRPFSA